MKRLQRIQALFAIMMMLAICANAQKDAAKWDQRIERDSAKTYPMILKWFDFCKQNDTIYAKIAEIQDKDNENDYEMYPRPWSMDSYKAWMYTTQNAPFVDYRLYAGNYAPDMFRYLIRTEQDPAVKSMYFDELIRMSQFRVDNLDRMNAFKDMEGQDFGIVNKSALADVKAWLAHYYFTEGKNIPASLYSKEQAYKNYVDAMEEVRKQKDMKGTEVEPYLVNEYFASCLDLYNSDKDKYFMQLMQDYLDCTSTCQHLYETAKDKPTKDEADGQFNRYYNQAFVVIRDQFNATPLSDPDSLDAYFKNTFDEKKEDITYVNKAIEMMVRAGSLPNVDLNRCIEKYADVSYKNQDSLTYFAALAYGLTRNKLAALEMDSVSKMTKRIEMRDAFDKAISLAKSDVEKAEVCYQIGKALNQRLDPVLASDPEEVSRWKNDMEGVIKYFEQAIELDPDHYAVVANYNLELVHRRIGEAFVNDDYFNSFNAQDRYSIRKDTYDFLQKAILYANTTIQEANLAMENYTFEQDGTYIKQLLANAQNNAPTKLAGDVKKSVDTYAQAFGAAASGKAQKQKDRERFEKWHQGTYHPYLRKKGQEQAFFTGKGAICEYCHKEFK